MSIKILETKLQTLLENDKFIINEENIIKLLGKEIANLLKDIAECNEGITLMDIVRDSYSKKFNLKIDNLLFISKSNDIVGMLEKIRNNNINKILDIIEEIFTNQELYNYLKEEIPVIKKIVAKLNSDNCPFSLDDILEWFDDEFSLIKIKELEDMTIYEYLSILFREFNSFFILEETKNIVKN